MTQEPWNEGIYENAEENSRRSRNDKGAKSSAIFTVLACVFVFLVAAITIFAIYLSSGGSKTNSTQEFYNVSSASKNANKEAQSSSGEQTSSSAVTTASSAVTTASSAATTSSSAPEGSTLTVNAGEGEAAIAARAGISIADLERLNPDKMSGGSWLAHPGDTVRIK